MPISTSELSCPIPLEAIAELEQLLGRSLDGWDRSPPRYVSPVPDVEGAWFDAKEVARVIRVLRKLPHTKDRWAGTAFDPEPWQVVWIIAPVFGWKHPDGRRIVREVWFEVPRKNGKSSVASRLMIVLLAGDRQMGAEVYAAATATEQARQVFGEAQTVVRRSTALRGKVEVLTSVMRVPATGGIFRVLSKVAETAHGLNVSGGVVDEVHLHKKRDLIDAIETGTAARQQPLLIYITTAGTDDETTIYAEKHGYAIGLAEGKSVDPDVWVVLWKAEDDADPFSEETWIAANPNFPISPTREYLVAKAKKAKERPSFLPTFKRLHLNIRGTKAAEAWDGADAWPIGAQSVDLAKHRGEPVWLGLVCSSATDLSSIAILGRDDDGERYWGAWRWFVPEDTIADLDRRTDGNFSGWLAAKLWRIDVTEGNVTDVAAHVEGIRELGKRFDIQELVYDPNGSIGVVSPLIDELAERLFPIYATNPGSSLMDWERLLKSRAFNHGGDPLAAWQVGNLRVKDSATKITRIDRRNSADNVSGVAAMELVLRRAIVGNPFRSVYEDEDVMTV